MLCAQATAGDHVALFDGPDENAHKFRPNGQLTGALESLPQARSQALPCFCFQRFVVSHTPHAPELTGVGVFGVRAEDVRVVGRVASDSIHER